MAAELAQSGGPAQAHEMPPARVARLANDIAVQFPHLPDDQAAEAIAAHVKLYWEPRMVAGLTALAGRPDSGLTARAGAAARLLAG